MPFERSHSQKWLRMYVLAAYTINIGKKEDELITCLRKHYGERCANARGGGGGASPYKPNLLYVCVGRL